MTTEINNKGKIRKVHEGERSYSEIAKETGTTTKQVLHAMASAEKTYDPLSYDSWFVCARGYGDWMTRASHAEGWGATREAAVIDALTRHPERF